MRPTSKKVYFCTAVEEGQGHTPSWQKNEGGNPFRDKNRKL